MSAFDYLSVLISIILGLGITQILSGFGRLLNVRGRVRWYGPAVAWGILLLLIHVQTWWAMFQLRALTLASWTLPVFLFVLLLPVLLYLMAALALPDAGGTEPIDMRASYHAHAGWFFGLAMLVIATSMVRPIVLGGRFRLDPDHAFQTLFFAASLGGALTHREWYHRWMTAVFFVLILFYVLSLFARLR